VRLGLLELLESLDSPMVLAHLTVIYQLGVQLYLLEHVLFRETHGILRLQLVKVQNGREEETELRFRDVVVHAPEMKQGSLFDLIRRTLAHQQTLIADPLVLHQLLREVEVVLYLLRLNLKGDVGALL